MLSIYLFQNLSFSLLLCNPIIINTKPLTFNLQTQIHLPDQTLLFSDETSKLRWFMLPSEANQALKDKNKRTIPDSTLPFEPPSYPLSGKELGRRREHLKRCQPPVTSTSTQENAQKGQRSVNGYSSYGDGMEQHQKDVSFGLGQDAGQDDSLDDRTNEDVPMRSSDAQRFIDSVNEGFEVSHDPSSVSPDMSPDTCESHANNVIPQEELVNKGSGELEGDVGERTARLSNGNGDDSDVRTASLSDQVGLTNGTQSMREKAPCSVNDATLSQDGTLLHKTEETGAIVDVQPTLEMSVQKESSSNNDNSGNSDGCIPCQQQRATAPSSESAQLSEHSRDNSGASGVCQVQEAVQPNGERHDGIGEPAVKFKVPTKKIFKPTLQVRKVKAWNQ